MAPADTSPSVETAVIPGDAANTPALEPQPRPRPRQFKKVEVVIPRRGKSPPAIVSSAPSQVGPLRTPKSTNKKTKKATKKRKKGPAPVEVYTARRLVYSDEQLHWLCTVCLDTYMSVRWKPDALATFRTSMWTDFVALWPDYDDPPFPEEADMVRAYRSNQERLLTRALEGIFLWNPIPAEGSK